MVHIQVACWGWACRSMSHLTQYGFVLGHGGVTLSCYRWHSQRSCPITDGYSGYPLLLYAGCSRPDCRFQYLYWGSSSAPTINSIMAIDHFCALAVQLPSNTKWASHDQVLQRIQLTTDRLNSEFAFKESIESNTKHDHIYSTKATFTVQHDTTNNYIWYTKSLYGVLAPTSRRPKPLGFPASSGCKPVVSRTLRHPDSVESMMSNSTVFGNIHSRLEPWGCFPSSPRFFLRPVHRRSLFLPAVSMAA